MRWFGVLVLLGLAVMAPSAAAATRYASPTGGGDCSSPATACSLATAFDGAVSGDEIVVGAGRYAAVGDLSDDVARVLTIRGAVIGAGRPVLDDVALRLSSAGSSVQDLTLRATGGLRPLTLVGGAGGRRVLATWTQAGSVCL
jgi:hypothetical protein